jgi:AcrR family transcriptional regulator
MAGRLSAIARAKMLRATQDLVRERGLDAFTVEAVAAASGVAKTTIYRHFASADELLLAALSEIAGEVTDIDTGDVHRDLVEMMRRYVELAARPDIRQIMVAVMQRAATDEEFGRLRQRHIAERKAPVRLAIQRGIAAGVIDPTIDIETVAAMLEGPVIARAMHDRSGFRPGEIEQIVGLVLRAVAPRDRE